MKNTIKRGGVVLFIGMMFLFPSSSLAATQEESKLQKIELIKQLIQILTVQMQSLIELEKVDSNEQTIINKSSFGSTMQEEQTQFAITVSLEFGKGSWEEFDANCRGDRTPGYDCSNEFLDGVVKFVINEPYKDATIIYYPTDTPENKTETALNGAMRGYFEGNTEYTWKIIARNKANESAETTGTFKTGDY